MRYKFQHFIDISTSASSMTMLKINAGGEYAMQRMKHLWGAFKYVKMGRVSIKLLPASTLPVDPLGLGYSADDPQTVDPRDQMNPGLVRITNGEDIVDNFTDYSDAQMEQVYINTMLDPRWSKFMLQSGFKRSAYPLYWNVGQLQQDVYPGSVVNLPHSSNGNYITSTSSFQFTDAAANVVDGGSTNYSPNYANRDFTDPRGFFQVGHRGRMGWMPTDAFEHITYSSNNAEDVPLVQPLPSVNVITVLLPKAFKTLYYYRLFITEEYFLSGIKNTGINDAEGVEHRAVDNFLAAYYPTPQAPSVGITYPTPPFGRPNVKNTGEDEY